MHRRVRDKLEDILAEGDPASFAAENAQRGRHSGKHGHDTHLTECAKCREAVAAMRDQQVLLRSLRLPEEAEPRAGFYARVIERIEAQGAASIWSLFFDSAVGRGLAMASMVLALSAGAYLVSVEYTAAHQTVQTIALPDLGADSGGVLTGSPDRNAVLVNLVTYREP
jgi:hypothetical protein